MLYTYRSVAIAILILFRCSNASIEASIQVGRQKWLLALSIVFVLCAGCRGPEAVANDTKNLSVTPFEEMLEGFAYCKFKDLYLDLRTQEPVHRYFSERNLKPYKIQKGFAYFKVNEKFYGLPVIELMIPASTFDIHALWIDLPIEIARDKMNVFFGGEFRPNKLSDDGERPYLIADPSKPTKSVFTCNTRAD